VFKEEIDIQEDKITVRISCKKREYATEERLRWCLDPLLLIPEEYKNNLTLVSKPDKIVSNIVGDSNYTTTGTWVYEIKKTTKTTKPKQTRTRRTRKANKED